MERYEIATAAVLEKEFRKAPRRTGKTTPPPYELAGCAVAMGWAPGTPGAVEVARVWAAMH